jgi:outer membrane protein assembly factor BamE (lipoprotein component of BamABCDE complex)
VDRRTLSIGVALLSLSACRSAQQHQAAVADADKSKLTVAAVQREIRVGMSGDEVVAALGAPNIVTTDDRHQESWIYDRFATEHVYSTSTEGVAALILGGGAFGSGAMAGAGGSGIIAGAGARSTTQRTLTIIIKFDASRRVRDFAYRQSSF